MPRTVLCLAFSLLACRSAIHGPELPYRPAKVEPRGELVLVSAFGPPNYGETPGVDDSTQVPILKLFSPVSVLGRPNDPDEVNRESVFDVARSSSEFAAT